MSQVRTIFVLSNNPDNSLHFFLIDTEDQFGHAEIFSELPWARGKGIVTLWKLKPALSIIGPNMSINR